MFLSPKSAPPVFYPYSTSCRAVGCCVYTLLVMEHYKPRSPVFFCNLSEQAPLRETSEGGSVRQDMLG